MKTTILHLHTEFQIGQVDPRIFGGFLEHMGRAVYQGIYDPQSVHADEYGLRQDVISALRGLNFTAMRYPGGNFASGYHWLDGIGPRSQRPTVRELAWQSLEPNQFGTDEFIQLCQHLDWTPMLTVNLGTGSPEEARNWVEYCNSPAGSKYADLRKETQPHNVKLWCLGNEMDGPWQLGHVPAGQYAIRAQQAAKMMKDVDPGLELVACGSSGPQMLTFAEWDQEVLEYIGDLVDYVSLHRYVGNYEKDTANYLAITNSIDQQIEEIDAVCRTVQAKKHAKKRAYLCFDEWNVWYKNQLMDGEGKFAPHLIEEIYNLEDALVVAGFLNSFIRHADVVKIANLAQIVNVIAPIQTRGDQMLIQSIYYPFEMFSKRRKGISLQPTIRGPVYESASYGEASYIDSSVILNANQLHLFLVNRHLEEMAPLQVNLADQKIVRLENGEVLTGNAPQTASSFENPSIIKSQNFSDVQFADDVVTLNLPPLSVTALTFELETR